MLLIKNPKLVLKNVGASLFGVFLWNTWKINLRLHKYGFVLLNRLRIATNTFSETQKQQNFEKGIGVKGIFGGSKPLPIFLAGT